MSIYHVQPQGFTAWDYDENLTAGTTLEARRQILAQIVPLYLLLEGGLGAVQEAWKLFNTYTCKPEEIVLGSLHISSRHTQE